MQNKQESQQDGSYNQLKLLQIKYNILLKEFGKNKSKYQEELMIKVHQLNQKQKKMNLIIKQNQFLKQNINNVIKQHNQQVLNLQKSIDNLRKRYSKNQSISIQSFQISMQKFIQKQNNQNQVPLPKNFSFGLFQNILMINSIPIPPPLEGQNQVGWQPTDSKQITEDLNQDMSSELLSQQQSIVQTNQKAQTTKEKQRNFQTLNERKIKKIDLQANSDILLSRLNSQKNQNHINSRMSKTIDHRFQIENSCEKFIDLQQEDHEVKQIKQKLQKDLNSGFSGYGVIVIGLICFIAMGFSVFSE